MERATRGTGWISCSEWEGNQKEWTPTVKVSVEKKEIIPDFSSMLLNVELIWYNYSSGTIL